MDKITKITVVINDQCGCCHKYIPKVEHICADRGIECTVEDVNEAKIDFHSYGFRGVPFTVVYSGKNIINAFTGDMSIERIIKNIFWDE